MMVLLGTTRRNIYITIQLCNNEFENGCVDVVNVLLELLENYNT